MNQIQNQTPEQTLSLIMRAAFDAKPTWTLRQQIQNTMLTTLDNSLVLDNKAFSTQLAKIHLLSIRYIESLGASLDAVSEDILHQQIKKEE